MRPLYRIIEKEDKKEQATFIDGEIILEQLIKKAELAKKSMATTNARNRVHYLFKEISNNEKGIETMTEKRNNSTSKVDIEFY